MDTSEALAILQATKYKTHVKAKIEEDYKENGQRTYKQVDNNACLELRLLAVLHVSPTSNE